ncbi:MAG: hypothetical protein NC241_03625 [Bacteroides sp.]|nr:hypothetical protein [Bacteroides sp.]MCM1457922.1 hypothetical protein [Lachnoclostridium sp.]
MVEALLSGFGGGLVVSKLLDTVLPFGMTAQGKLFKRQAALQRELEKDRENFQERMEERRMRFQANLEAQRAELQKYLTERNIEANREIALFQARAMRRTQMMLAQENARNVLQDHLLQDALRTFPLNVSPLVLLHNQGHSPGHLLAFAESEQPDALSLCQAYEEVEAWRRRPEPLNIFVAPTHIDSKIKNRRALSDQIWDTVYQRIESFFTRHYSRTGSHPVIFYPTAWSDNSTPGMHAAETLHFFLKDLPCIVIEPRFDGSTFRLMFSAWGMGYNSTVHHRTELSFPVNIDIALATAAYERSRRALAALEEAERLLDPAETGFADIKKTLTRNLDLYEALHIDDRIAQGRMDEVEALGIYNIFNIEPSQDLAGLAEKFASQIGLNLAVLADIHHLRCYDAAPLLPGLLKKEFPDLYKSRPLRESIFNEYERTYTWLRREESEYDESGESRLIEAANVKKTLALTDEDEYAGSVAAMLSKYMADNFGQSRSTLEDNLSLAIELMRESDIAFFQRILEIDSVASNRTLYRRLNAKIFSLQNP